MIDMQYGVLTFSLFSYFHISRTQAFTHKKCTVKICFLCIEAKFIFMMDFIEDRTNIYISLFMHIKGIIL